MRKKDDPVQNDVQKAHVFVDNCSSKSCFKGSPRSRRSCWTWWANNKQGTDVKRALSIPIGLSQWLNHCLQLTAAYPTLGRSEHGETQLGLVFFWVRRRWTIFDRLAVNFSYRYNQPEETNWNKRSNNNPRWSETSPEKARCFNNTHWANAMKEATTIT